MILRRSIAILILLCLLLQLQTWGGCAMQSAEGSRGAEPACCGCCPSDSESAGSTQPLKTEDEDCSLCGMRDLLGKIVLSESAKIEGEQKLTNEPAVLYPAEKLAADNGVTRLIRIDPPPLWVEAARSGVYLI